MSIKEKIYAHCLQLLNEKIHEMRYDLHELMEGAKNDAKSSAGDKYESSSSIVAQEKEKIGKQLQEAMDQKAVLEKIDLTINSSQIIKGSLVKTDKGIIFISIALGKIIVESTPVIIISPQSPLGIKLMGLKQKDSTEINGVKYFIESVK